MSIKFMTELRKALIEDPKYSIIFDNKDIGGRIDILCLGGSHAYGTNTEDSDIDIRGVAHNSANNILLMKDFEHFRADDIDTTIYSLNKILPMLLNCNPNTIEILGCLPRHYIQLSEIGRELISLKDAFLSKRCINSFGGYAKSQLHELDKLVNPAPEEFYDEAKEDLIIKFDTRNRKAIEHKKLGKHMMHLVRLYLMAFDILEDGQINTYRNKDRDFLMDIRNGKYLDDNQMPTKAFTDIINELDVKFNILKDNTCLPDNPDIDRINKFLSEVNKHTVINELKTNYYHIGGSWLYEF